MLEVDYVQPALGDGLARDRGLCLIALPPVPALTGGLVRDFLRELYAATEGTPDRELEKLLAGIPASVSFRTPI